MAVNDRFYCVSFRESLKRLTPAAMAYLLAEQEFMLRNIARDSIALEVGCGTGRLTKLVAPVTECITALDYSKTQLEEAAGELSGWKDKVTFVLGNARNPPLLPKWYDVALLGMNTLNSLDEPCEGSQLDALSGANKLLVREGKLVFTVWGMNALPVQIPFYAGIVDGVCVEAAEFIQISNCEGIELKIKRTPPEKLEEMLNKTGFKLVAAEQITEYNIGYVAVKK